MYLSPNLFKIFINDLPDYLLHSFDPVYINNNRIDCLLYADDVILLSNSQKGLQSKLDSLELFCKEWCMSVNISKTKVVIFNKSGRFIKQNFLLNNKVLDCCNSYKYLGITFSSSGSFTESKTELYKKAVKAFFKLKADVLSLYPMPKTSLHIFDHTVKPILLYCSEIWGCYLPKSADFNFMFDYSRLSSVLPCDKLHIHFCKYILGANKTSTNFAILSELGRIPFALDCFTSVFKYWYRLDSSTNFLLKSAYIENKFLHSQGCDTWYSGLQRLFKIFDNNTGIHNMLKYKHNTFKRKIKVYTKAFYKNKWYVKRNKLLDENGKLRTYLKLKCNFGFENYLHILSDFNQRKSFTKFRISNHKLKIETGRYSKPITPLENRICEKCFSDEIESEEHLLLKCSFYYTSRRKLLETIKNNINHSNFEKLSFGDKFIWLLNSESKDTLICMCDFLLKSHCFG